MKYNRLIAGVLAVSLLCCGCSANQKSKDPGKETDSAAAYEKLAQEMTKWDGSGNLSTTINGSIFTEYLKVPSAVSMVGQYMQQAGENGNEIFGTMNMDYGDGYYYSSTFLGDGAEFAIGLETGATDVSAEVEPVYIGEYVDAATFNANVTYGVPVLAFEAGQIQRAATEKNENGDTVYTFILDPAQSEATVIELLEHMQQINTEVVPVTADISSVRCTATYAGDSLIGLGYKFSADLTAEGEVMDMNYDVTHGFLASGDEVNFAMPNFSYIVTNTNQLPVVE